MKQLITAVIAAILFTGCALFSGDAATKAKTVERLCYSAASIGGQEAMSKNPGVRPQFETAYNSLDQLIKSKIVTGFLLRDIMSKLPVKELKSREATIAIEGATMLYDILVGDALNIENQPYVIAAATGIRDGLGVALGK